jgi:hypothetical protein
MTATTEEGFFRGTLAKVNAFRRRHELAETLIVFVGGFIFDVLTLSRADDSTTLIQQGAYLAALCALLALEQRQALKGDLPKRLAKGMELAEPGVHFFLGALLSTFTLNYFKSGSGLTSLAFVAVAFVLLVANEFPRFRAYGQVVRFTLLSFCLLSYFACVIPVLVGKVRPWMFVTATVLSVGAMGGIFWQLNKWSPTKRALLTRSVLPAMGVQALLLALYFAKIIPPVPLALTYIGIYHGVEKPVPAAQVQATGPGVRTDKPVIREERFVTHNQYRLLHERPWWRFWQRGDQEFYAREGDQVYCFFSIFAPNKFQDQIDIIWTRWDEGRGEWLLREKAAVPLGRGGAIAESGWRWFRSKARYEPGDWRAEVQTEDGRTIGGIRFTIYKDTRTEPRQFVMDLR